jgi:F0F1-type ATP synthase assembly protein I
MWSGFLSAKDSNQATLDNDQEIGPRISQSLRAQSLTGIALALALMVIGPIAAYSSLFGSLAAFVPAVVFAALVAPKIGSESEVFLRAAVIGEAVKLILTGVICAVVFVWVEPLAAGWFFAGMILVIFIGYFGLYRG